MPTIAQLEFAELLGREFAQLWLQRRERQEIVLPDNLPDKNTRTTRERSANTTPPNPQSLK